MAAAVTNFVSNDVSSLFGWTPSLDDLVAFDALGWVYSKATETTCEWKLTAFGQSLRSSVCLVDLTLGEARDPQMQQFLTSFAVNNLLSDWDDLSGDLLRMANEGFFCCTERAEGEAAVAVSAKGLFCTHMNDELTDGLKKIFAVLRDKGLMESKYNVQLGDWRWSPTDLGVERGLASDSDIAVCVLARLELGPLLLSEIEFQIRTSGSEPAAQYSTSWVPA